MFGPQARTFLLAVVKALKARVRKTASQCCDRLLRDLGIDKKMSKEELIQFEGLVIETCMGRHSEFR